MLLELGNRYDSVRPFDEAAKCYDIATAKRPISSTGWVHLSELLIKTGKKSQASDVLTKAIRLLRASSPSTPGKPPAAADLSELESALGRSLETRGRYDDAEVTSCNAHANCNTLPSRAGAGGLRAGGEPDAGVGGGVVQRGVSGHDQAPSPPHTQSHP